MLLGSYQQAIFLEGDPFRISSPEHRLKTGGVQLRSVQLLTLQDPGSLLSSMRLIYSRVCLLPFR